MRNIGGLLGSKLDTTRRERMGESMGSGADGISHFYLAGLEWQPQRALPQLEWQAVVPLFQLARQ